jgi:3-deoxy-D-manno-octulosonic-acid transferase
MARAARDDDALAARQGERHGAVPEAGGELWIHAASVGEVHASAPLIRALRKRHPSQSLLLTSFTHTGAQAIERLHPDRTRLRQLFVPFDTPRRVARWLDRTRPAGLILVETELWPELLIQCAARSIPIAMVSARLSENSLSRLRRFGRLARQMLSGVAPILCQSAADRDRLIALGLPAGDVQVTGNLKFDVGADAVVPKEVLEWQRLWSERPTWVAGSTHPAEEGLLAQAHRSLRQRRGTALMVLVPRHPERAGDALMTLQQQGLRACRIGDFDASSEVEAVVVDRLGVLAGLYANTDLGVVCGSLAPGVGGHNLLEPAHAGRPVLTGRWTESQRAVADGLRSAAALVEVDGADTLATMLDQLFSDPRRAAALGEAARTWARSQGGAVARTLERLEPWLASVKPG